MAELNISEELQRLVEQNGDTVAIHSGDCVIWKAEHQNCKGCSSELGCGKLVRLMLSMMSSYEPRDYGDFCQRQNRISELQKKVLNAHSPDELRAIPSF